MRSGALLGLITWQVMLADCVPTVHRSDHVAPRSFSNIELLIPLVMSDKDGASDESEPRAASNESERYDRARLDKDMPFSNIPSSAFVLDESQPSSSHKNKRGHKHSRKQDLTSTASLENEESDESEESAERSELDELASRMWRACSQLVRAVEGGQHELLLALCSELLAAPPAPPPCPCCAQWAGPGQRARRDYVPLGDNSYWVMNYLNAPRRIRHRPDVGEE